MRVGGVGKDGFHRKHVDMLTLSAHTVDEGLEPFGSVAEQIFRHADGPVLTVGPGSSPDSPVEPARALQPILFAPDFEEGSLHALRYDLVCQSLRNEVAVRCPSCANLLLILMLQGSHRPTADAVRDLQEHVRADSPPAARGVSVAARQVGRPC